ncbi:MAG TPA: hypothetical protein VFK57_04375 [Vicinamibacterales bacterium]|nr:hypothetical protein [Vicinamibacterales bacterium]
MNEDALRSIIRETIARVSARGGDPVVQDEPRLLHLTPHPSSYQYALPPSDGPCIIEPGVACNHCGYCQTHGH